LIGGDKEITMIISFFFTFFVALFFSVLVSRIVFAHGNIRNYLHDTASQLLPDI